MNQSSIRVPVPTLLVRGLLVAALPLLIGTCRIADLVRPPEGALLCLVPEPGDTLRDSAPVGSMAPRAVLISINNCGGSELKWNADIQGGSPWVEVQPDTGTAGFGPPVNVIFHPDTLDTGMYHEIAVVNSPAASAAQEVPLSFKVYPCRPHPITVDDSVSDSLTSADCGAPHRPGRFAQIFNFNGIAAESVSIEVPASFDAFVALDSSPLAATVTPLATNNACLGSGNDPCIYYHRLPRNTTYFVEVTSADSADSGAFTMRLVHPRKPNVPDSLDQRLATDSTTPVVPGGQIGQLSVALRAVVSDPDLGDTLHLEAEVRPADSTFTGFATAVGGEVPNGSPAYVVYSGLRDNTNYNWRVRTVDQTGRASGWRQFSADPAFDVQAGHDPSMTNPNQYQSDGTTPIAPGGSANQPTVIFKAVLSDQDVGDLLQLEVEVKPVGTGFDSLATAPSPPVSSGATATVTVAAPTLTAGTDYHWQARAVDNTGRHSGWTSFGPPPETNVDFHVSTTVSELVFTTQPAVDTAGRPVRPAVVVAARDANHNVVTAFNDPITIQITTNPAGGTLTGTPTVNASGGIATFPNLIIDKAGTGYRITATIGTVSSNPSNLFNVIAAPATQLFFSTNPPASTQAGVNMSIVVTAQDQFANTATSFAGAVTLAITPGTGTPGASLNGGGPVTAVGGVASFPNANIQTAGTSYTLTASSGALTPKTSTGFNITAGPATHLGYQVQPSSAQQNVAIAPAIEVEGLDQFNNLATSFTGPVSLAITPGTGTAGAVLSGLGPTNAITGVATFSSTSIDRTGTGYRLNASSTGLTGITSNLFDITVGQVSPATSTVQASPSTITACQVGCSPGTTASTITVTAKDGSGGVVAGASVTISVTGTGNTYNTGAVITNGSGVATFTLNSTVATVPPATELKIITATANGSIPINQKDTVTVNAAALASLLFTNQPGTTTAGVAINSGTGGVVVTGRDQFLNTATGFNGNVSMAIVAGPGGVFTPTSTTTVAASSGVATFTNLRIYKSGSGYQLQASGGGFSTPSSSAFAINPAPANKLLFTTQPQNTEVLARIDSAIGGVVVTVQDSVGNTVPTFSGTVRINIGIDPPGGTTLTGGSPITPTLGVATFQNLTLNKLGTGFTLLTSTTTGGVGGDESDPFNIIPGPAKTLEFSVQPTQTVAGQTITPAPQVRAKDIQGNVATGFTGNVTVAIGTNGGTPPGTLAGTLTHPAVAGVAQFPGLSINNAGPTPYTLIGTTPALPSGPVTQATSNSFNIIAGGVSPAQSTVVAAPSSMIACKTSCTPGSNTASLITVTAKDGNGNPIQGLTVVLSSNGNGDAITQPATTTNASGVATGTISDTVVEALTISATIDGVPINQQPSVSVTAGSPAILFFITQPRDTTAGSPLRAPTPGIQVRVLDQFRNNIPGATNSVLISILVPPSPPGATLSGAPNPKAAVGGIATFTNLSINQIGNGYQLLAASTGLTADSSNVFNITSSGVVSASQSTVTAVPSSITACSASCTTGGGTATTITVTAKDALGNGVPGASVTLSVSPGTGNGFSPAGLTQTANGSGVAVWTFHSSTAETKTASAIANSVGITQQATITVNAATVSASVSTVSASLSSINACQSSCSTGASTASLITVTAKDQFGNGIPSASVTIAVSPSTGNGFSPAGLTQTANGSGVAQWTFNSTTAQAKTVSATINTVGINQQPSVTVTAAGVSSSHSLLSAGAASITACSVSITPPCNNGNGKASVITATVRDQFDNPIQGATVVYSSTGGGNNFTSPATTNSSGVTTSTFSATVAEGKTISATAQVGANPAVSITQTAAVTVDAAAAAALFFTTQPPSSTPANTDMSPAVVVTARDQFGNTATSFTGTVTLDLTPANNGEGATLAGNSVSAVAGEATFNNLQVSAPDDGSGYNLDASASSLTGDTSDLFTIT